MMSSKRPTQATQSPCVGLSSAKSRKGHHQAPVGSVARHVPIARQGRRATVSQGVGAEYGLPILQQDRRGMTRVLTRRFLDDGLTALLVG